MWLDALAYPATGFSQAQHLDLAASRGTQTAANLDDTSKMERSDDDAMLRPPLFPITGDCGQNADKENAAGCSSKPPAKNEDGKENAADCSKPPAKNESEKENAADCSELPANKDSVKENAQRSSSRWRNDKDNATGGGSSQAKSEKVRAMAPLLQLDSGTQVNGLCLCAII